MNSITHITKAILAGIIAFAGAALSTIPDGNAPTTAQWLTAAVAGLLALSGVYGATNKGVPSVTGLAADLAKLQQFVSGSSNAAAAAPAPRAKSSSAGTVYVDVVPRLAPGSVEAAAVQAAGPITPAPVVEASSDPVSPPAYTGPIPPVSEPVGATAVSATP